MALRLLIDQTRRCADCAEPLPRIASKLFKENEGCCPRCAFIHQEVGLDLDDCEIRDMSVKGQATIVISRGIRPGVVRPKVAVPRVELHPVGRQPANAIPL